MPAQPAQPASTPPASPADLSPVSADDSLRLVHDTSGEPRTEGRSDAVLAPGAFLASLGGTESSRSAGRDLAQGETRSEASAARLGPWVAGLALAALASLLPFAAAPTPAQEAASTSQDSTSQASTSRDSTSQDSTSQAAPRALRQTPPLWIEILDERGRPAETADASGIELEVGGHRAEILELGRPLRLGADRARIVLYFDQALAGRGALGRAADALADQATALGALGDVEIVSARAGEPPRAQVRSSEPIVLSQRLERMSLTERSERLIYSIRERTLDSLRQVGSPVIETGVGTGSAPDPARVAQLVRETLAGIEEERALVLDRLHAMVGWVTAPEIEPTTGPRILMAVLEGYDLDPVDFYAQRLDESTARALVREAARLPSLGTETRALDRALAAAGWTVLPVSMPITRDEKKAAEFTVLDSPDDDPQTGDGKTLLPGVTLRPGQLFGRKKSDDEATELPVALGDPLAPLERMAADTGGQVLTHDQALRDTVGRLGDRRSLRLRTSLDHRDGLVPLAVRARDSAWSLRAPRWISRGTPTKVAQLRLDSVLRGDEGQLALAAVLEVPTGLDSDTSQPVPATLETRLDLHDLEGETASLGRAAVRITVEATGPRGSERLSQEILVDQDLEQGADWSWRADLVLPAETVAVAVLVEELNSGLWGGRRATVVRSGAEAASAYLPSPKVLEIERPEEAVLRGRITFSASVYDARIRQLRFLLDDRLVAESTGAPWQARLSLGRTPRRQTLTVVGVDASGVEIGRETAVLNGGESGLAVEIVAPQSTRGTGAVEVEAEVAVPVERQLDRVLFFWNNEQVATLFAPPFRQRVIVPEDRPVGYVRVVALLDDGSLAEDVLFMNGPEAGERLDVSLVELYVVVTDRDGRPVRDLGREAFSVREDGVPQQIATFSDAADLPLTLGMTIDSSASMFVKMPRIQRAATRFLRSTFGEHDRAFVVDFDSTPRLVRGTTGDLDRLEDSIYGLEADGKTALWEAVVYSLVQLQGVRGRKALVVFSDGADEDEQFPFRTAMRIGREMGVPIYLILMKKAPETSADLGLFSRSFQSRSERLTEATGGRVFYGKEYDDLGDVYAEIERELRSQYLLTYYPSEEKEERGWREVDVDVEGRGLTPRTSSGYWN